jgi:hypothetical protein
MSATATKLLPRDQFPPGIDNGDFVPLTAEEFCRSYTTLNMGLDGLLPCDPSFPTEIQDAKTGEARPLEDTPFNRAYYSATKQFGDLAARVNFGWRVETVLPIAMSKKYRKYVNLGAGSLHITLLAAVVSVRGSYRRPRRSALRSTKSSVVNSQSRSTLARRASASDDRQLRPTRQHRGGQLRNGRHQIEGSAISLGFNDRSRFLFSLPVVEVATRHAGPLNEARGSNRGQCQTSLRPHTCNGGADQLSDADLPWWHRRIRTSTANA